jgi:hypothetical protein
MFAYPFGVVRCGRRNIEAMTVLVMASIPAAGAHLDRHQG